MRVGVTIAALALLVAGAAQAVTPAPNVRGVITGAARSACPPGEPCDPHPVGVFVAFTRGTRVVARVKVARDGSFAVYLAPGRYGIRLQPPPLGAHLVPATVLVVRGKPAMVRIAVRRVVTP